MQTAAVRVKEERWTYLSEHPTLFELGNRRVVVLGRQDLIHSLHISRTSQFAEFSSEKNEVRS